MISTSIKKARKKSPGELTVRVDDSEAEEEFSWTHYLPLLLVMASSNETPTNSFLSTPTAAWPFDHCTRRQPFSLWLIRASDSQLFCVQQQPDHWAHGQSFSLWLIRASSDSRFFWGNRLITAHTASYSVSG